MRKEMERLARACTTLTEGCKSALVPFVTPSPHYARVAARLLVFTSYTSDYVFVFSLSVVVPSPCSQSGWELRPLDAWCRH